MALRPEFRWLFYTALIVGLLLLISAMALDRPDVTWLAGKPHCPQCMAEVNDFSSKCAGCNAQFDWSVAPDEASPISEYSLSALEDEHLRGLVSAMGKEAAAANVATALSISVEAATAYLETIGRGRCGHCGGTGIELATLGSKDEVECQVCFGARACVGCGGDRRVRVGDIKAARAFEAYLADLRDIRGRLPLDVQRDEVRRLTKAFLKDHAGTREAAGVFYWVDWKPNAAHFDAAQPAPLAVEIGRRRIDEVLDALRTATSDN